MHEVIVACVDGSKGGYAAVAEAAELAKRFRALLTQVWVTPHGRGASVGDLRS